jgi:hypothetical protein
MLTYEVAIRISWQNNNTTIFNPWYIAKVPGKKCRTKYLQSSTP